MNIRAKLAGDLAGALPGYRVIGYARDLEALTRPTVMVWASLIERFEQFGLDRLKVTVEAWVLVGGENPEKLNDDLDDALSDVLGALQGLDYLEWTTAERGVLHETYHGYRLTALAVAQIGA